MEWGKCISRCFTCIWGLGVAKLTAHTDLVKNIYLPCYSETNCPAVVSCYKNHVEKSKGHLVVWFWTWHFFRDTSSVLARLDGAVPLATRLWLADAWKADVWMYSSPWTSEPLKPSVSSDQRIPRTSSLPPGASPSLCFSLHHIHYTPSIPFLSLCLSTLYAHIYLLESRFPWSSQWSGIFIGYGRLGHILFCYLEKSHRMGMAMKNVWY